MNLIAFLLPFHEDYDDYIIDLRANEITNI